MLLNVATNTNTLKTLVCARRIHLSSGKSHVFIRYNKRRICHFKIACLFLNIKVLNHHTTSDFVIIANAFRYAFYMHEIEIEQQIAYTKTNTCIKFTRNAISLTLRHVCLCTKWLGFISLSTLLSIIQDKKNTARNFKNELKAKSYVTPCVQSKDGKLSWQMRTADEEKRI